MSIKLICSFYYFLPYVSSALKCYNFEMPYYPTDRNWLYNLDENVPANPREETNCYMCILSFVSNGGSYLLKGTCASNAQECAFNVVTQELFDKMLSYTVEGETISCCGTDFCNYKVVKYAFQSKLAANNDIPCSSYSIEYFPRNSQYLLSLASIVIVEDPIYCWYCSLAFVKTSRDLYFLEGGCSDPCSTSDSMFDKLLSYAMGSDMVLSNETVGSACCNEDYCNKNLLRSLVKVFEENFLSCYSFTFPYQPTNAKWLISISNRAERDDEKCGQCAFRFVATSGVYMLELGCKLESEVCSKTDVLFKKLLSYANGDPIDDGMIATCCSKDHCNLETLNELELFFSSNLPVTSCHSFKTRYQTRNASWLSLLGTSVPSSQMKCVKCAVSVVSSNGETTLESGCTKAPQCLSTQSMFDKLLMYALGKTVIQSNDVITACCKEHFCNKGILEKLGNLFQENTIKCYSYEIPYLPRNANWLFSLSSHALPGDERCFTKCALSVLISTSGNPMLKAGCAGSQKCEETKLMFDKLLMYALGKTAIQSNDVITACCTEDFCNKGILEKLGNLFQENTIKCNSYEILYLPRNASWLFSLSSHVLPGDERCFTKCALSVLVSTSGNPTLKAGCAGSQKCEETKLMFGKLLKYSLAETVIKSNEVVASSCCVAKPCVMEILVELETLFRKHIIKCCSYVIPYFPRNVDRLLTLGDVVVTCEEQKCLSQCGVSVRSDVGNFFLEAGCALPKDCSTTDFMFEILLADAAKSKTILTQNKGVGPACCEDNFCNSFTQLNLGKLFHEQKCWSFDTTMRSVQVGQTEIEQTKKRIICEKSNKCIVALQKSNSEGSILHGQCYPKSKLKCYQPEPYMCYMQSAVKNLEILNVEQLSAICCEESSGIMCHNDLVGKRLTDYAFPTIKCPLKDEDKLTCESFDTFHFDTGSVTKTTAMRCNSDQVCGIELLMNLPKQPFLKGGCYQTGECDHDIERIIDVASELTKDGSKSLNKNLKKRCCSTNRCNMEHAEIVYNVLNQRKCSVFHSDLSFELPSLVTRKPSTPASTKCFIQLMFERDKKIPIMWGNTIHRLKCDHSSIEKLYEDAKELIRARNEVKRLVSKTYCCYNEDDCNYDMLLALAQLIHEHKCWSFKGTPAFDIGRKEIEKDKSRIICDKSHQCVVALKKSEPNSTEPYLLHGQCYNSSKLLCSQPESYMCYMLSTINDAVDIDEDQLPAVCCRESFGTACHNDLVGKRIAEFESFTTTCPYKTDSTLKCQSFADFRLDNGAVSKPTVINCSGDQVCGVQLVENKGHLYLKGDCVEENDCAFDINHIIKIPSDFIEGISQQLPADVKPRCCSTNQCNREHAEIVYNTLQPKKCSSFHSELTFHIPSNVKKNSTEAGGLRCFIQMQFQPNKSVPIIWGNTVHWSQCDHNSVDNLYADAKQLMRMKEADETVISRTFCCYDEDECNYIMMLALAELIHEHKCWKFTASPTFDIGRSEIEQNKSRVICDELQQCIVTLDKSGNESYILRGQCYPSGKLKCVQPESYMCYMLPTVNNLQDIDEEWLPAVCCQESYGTACHNDIVGKRLTEYSYSGTKCPNETESILMCELFDKFDLVNGTVLEISTVHCNVNEVCGIILEIDTLNQLYLKGQCLEKRYCEYNIDRIISAALDIKRNVSNSFPADLKAQCCSTNRCNREHAELFYDMLHKRNCSNFKADHRFDLPTDNRNLSVMASSRCFIQIVFEPNRNRPFIWGNTIHWSQCDHSSTAILLTEAKNFARTYWVNETIFSQTFCCYDKNDCNYDIMVHVILDLFQCMRQFDFQIIKKNDSVEAVEVGRNFLELFDIMPSSRELEDKCPELIICDKKEYINLFEWNKTIHGSKTAYFRLSSIQIPCKEAERTCQNMTGIFLDSYLDENLTDSSYEYVQKIIDVAHCVWLNISQEGKCFASKASSKLEPHCQCADQNCLFYAVCMKPESALDQCQMEKLKADINLLQEIFKAAVGSEARTVKSKSEEFLLLALVDLSDKLLWMSKSTVPEVLLENVNIWTKVDLLTSNKMGNAELFIKKIFKYAALMNTQMQKAQVQQSTDKAAELPQIIIIDEKQTFVEHADNLLQRLTQQLLEKRNFESIEIFVSGGTFELIPLDHYRTNQSDSITIDHARVQIPMGSFNIRDSLMCNNELQNYYLKVVTFEHNFYNFIEPWRCSNAGSINISIILTPCNDKIDEIEIANMEQPIIIKFPVEKSETSNSNATLLTPNIKTHQLMAYHEIIFDQIHTTLIIAVNKSNPNTSLVLYFHQNALPWPSDYLDTIEFPVGQVNLVWFPKFKTGKNQRYFIGVAEDNPLAESPINFLGYQFNRDFTNAYSFKFFGASCLFLDFDAVIQDLFWNSQGCQIAHYTTETHISCKCKHLSTFAAGLLTTPNFIDFDYVMERFFVEQNITIYAVLILLFIIYLIAMLWAFLNDRSSRKADVFLIPDNIIADQYLYKIAAKTGFSSASSTDSVIKLILVGKDSSTEAMEFPSSKKLFRRCHTDYFVMTTERSLGELECCQIWHDNSGSGKFASWFLNSLIVYDVCHQKFYHFFYNNWLSTEHDPYSIEQTLPVCNVSNVDVKLAFRENLMRTFLHHHLWLSVITLPKASPFTRCQRVTSCFCIIYISMLACAMWCRYNNCPTSNDAIQFAQFTISWNEVYIGFYLALLVFPITFLTVQLFQRSKPRATTNYSTSQVNVLPSWCTYFGWLLAVITIVISNIFMVFYGLQMEESSARKWLTSFIVSILTSVIFIEPLKVILIVIVISVICRKIDVDSEEATIRILPIVTISSAPHDKEKTEENKQPKPIETPLEEIKIHSFFMELTVTTIFIMVVLLLVYCNRDHNGYLLQRHVTQMLTSLNIGYQQKTRHNRQYLAKRQFHIRNEDELWKWITDIVVSSLCRENSLQKSLIKDQVNMLVGYSRLRQVRVRKSSCAVNVKFKHLFPDCVDFLDFLNTEYNSYGPGWSERISKYRPEYHYVPADISIIPHTGIFGVYHGGGYRLVLRKTQKKVLQQLKNLKKERWIDYQTRAVIIEFSIYNAHINLFCVAYILIEAPATGGFEPSFHLQTVQLLKYGNVKQTCAELLFSFTVLMLIFSIMRKLMKIGLKTFLTIWNNRLDLAISFICLFIIISYFIRRAEMERVVEVLNATRGKTYVDLTYAAYLEQVHNYLLGMVVFVATVKFLRLFRFIKIISIPMDTLTKASLEIFGFGFVILLIMIAFASLMNLLIGRDLERFNTFFSCMEKCFGLSFSRREFYNVFEAKSFLGSITVLSYFCMSILLIHTIFMAILNSLVYEVKRNIDEQRDDYQTVLFAKEKILHNVIERNEEKRYDVRNVDQELQLQLQLMESRASAFEKYFNSHFLIKKPPLDKEDKTKVVTIKSRIITSD